MFSPHGNGMSCFSCEGCHCSFGVNCLDVTDDLSCPRCGDDDLVRLMERLIGRHYREYHSVEDYEKTVKMNDRYADLNVEITERGDNDA